MARPVGSTTRPQIRDFLKPVDIIDITKEGFKKAMEGDTVMMKFYLEQIYGKAPQSIDLNGGLNLSLIFDKTFNNGTLDTTPKTTNDNPVTSKV